MFALAVALNMNERISLCSVCLWLIKPAFHTLICPQMAHQSILPPPPRCNSSPAARSTHPIITPGSVSLLVCQPLVVISSRLSGIADRLLDLHVSNYRSFARRAVTGDRVSAEAQQNRGGINRAHCRNAMFVFISICWSHFVISSFIRCQHNHRGHCSEMSN